MPVDYESQKHRGFAFVVYETSEDAFQAVDNMNDSEISLVISQSIYKAQNQFL